MRTATVTAFGGPDVFRMVEAPDPVPGPGEVLIDVEVADTLFLETVVRSGAGQGFWPMRPPYVPGNGVAGVIGRVGDGVDANLLGRRVVAHTGNEGGYADRAVVPLDVVAAVPDALDLTVAAALLHDGPTALALFDITRIGVDDTVLVVGATGGLGILSVQLANARAARTVATARGPKLARVRELRPDDVVDTDRPDWLAAARALLPTGADVVLDNIGGDLGESAFGLVADGGRFSAHGTPSGRFANVDRSAPGATATGIEAVQLTPAELRRYTELALAEAVERVIEPVIGQVFPLDRAADAHTAIEGRTVFGKTLLNTTARR